MAIPAFGLGTFRLKDDVVISSVKTALELGYRAIDTAQIYDNEAAVGQAIAESGVPRHELYITTKIWIENLSKDKLRKRRLNLIIAQLIPHKSMITKPQ